MGGFQTELDAARAYDIAALSCKGPHVVTNYPEEAYAQELQETAGCSTVSAQSTYQHDWPLQLWLLLYTTCLSVMTFALSFCGVFPFHVQMTNRTATVRTTRGSVMNSAVKKVS